MQRLSRWITTVYHRMHASPYRKYMHLNHKDKALWFLKKKQKKNNDFHLLISGSLYTLVTKAVFGWLQPSFQSSILLLKLKTCRHLWAQKVLYSGHRSCFDPRIMTDALRGSQPLPSAERRNMGCNIGKTETCLSLSRLIQSLAYAW